MSAPVNDETREEIEALVGPYLADHSVNAMHDLINDLVRLVEQARAEAWDEGYGDGVYDGESCALGNDDEGATPNPYRAASTGENDRG